MSDAEIAWLLAGWAIGMFTIVGGRLLPVLWKWFKFHVWFDLRYAEGYRKGLAVGQRVARIKALYEDSE